jgi:OmpA-OmpF porin, OOP family
MAINLIDMAKSYLTDAVVSRVGTSLNESPDGIQKALGGAIPVVLGSLISKSSTPEGPGMLTGLLQQFTQGSATTADDDDPTTMMAKGGGILDSLLGSSGGLVSSALAQFSGVSSSSASGVMGLAGSLLTGLIGKQLTASGEGINAGSLVNLLASQKDSVAAAMPSGLSALLGNVPGLGALGGMLGGLSGGLGSALSSATGSVGSTLSGASTAASSVFNDVRSSVTPDDDDRGGGGFNFWPWLLAAAAAGLIYYFVRGCDAKKPDTAAIADSTAAMMDGAAATMDSAAANMGAAADSVGGAMAGAASDAMAALGAFGAKKLPDGVELNIPANGIENKLIAFIEDASKPVDKTTWFNFDRLLFETGSSKLKPESREQLQNIAAIMKAYPAINLKIGGYTDNTGNADANKKLSQSRAEATMKELTTLGVAAARLEAEGYGQEHPVATNDTEEGRAQNRRIACRVTKK